MGETMAAPAATEKADRAVYESVATVKSGVRGRLLNSILRHQFKRRLRRIAAKIDQIEATRRRLERTARWIREPKDGVQIVQESFGGVPVERLRQATSAREVLYLHGGGFALCSPRTHRAVTRRLAKLANATVVVPDYRLAPEHPYPAALDDAVAVYRAILERSDGRRIVIAGDSAGGNLALALLLAIKERGLPSPAAAACLSPWTDLTGSGESIGLNRHCESMLPAEKIAVAAALYAGDVDLKTPTVSPLFGDYAQLPPLLFHVGDTEILLDDTRRVAARAHAAGVDVTLRIWPDLPHVFHAFADFFPPARVALNEVADFVIARTM